MKIKLVMSLCLLMIIVPLISVQFNNIYHKNYGGIDRVVLVFSERPVYSLLEYEDYFQVEVDYGVKDPTVKEEYFTDNQVLRSFRYLQYDEKLIIKINLNENSRMSTGSDYKVEVLELSGSVFKLVLDVFNTSTPKTIKEHQEYADFYKSVGYNEKAEMHLNHIERLKSVSEDSGSPAIVEEVTETVVEEKPVEDIQPQQTKVEQEPEATGVQKSVPGITEFFISISIKTWILIMIILVILVALLIVFLNRQPSKPKLKKGQYRSTQGFGSDEFRRKMVFKMAESGWEEEAIAKELNIRIEEVQKILKS